MPTNEDVDRFIERVSQLTGIDSGIIQRDKATELWRILNRHGVLVPREIDEPVFDYLEQRDRTAARHMEGLSLGREYRAHTSSSLFADFAGEIDLTELQEPAFLYDLGLPQFLLEQAVRAYLT